MLQKKKKKKKKEIYGISPHNSDILDYFSVVEIVQTYLTLQFHKWRWSGFLWWCQKHQSRPQRRRVSHWVCCRSPATPRNPHQQHRWQKHCNLKTGHINSQNTNQQKSRILFPMTLYYILDHFARLILVTCVLQLGSVLLHLVLRASVSDRHDHPGDIPPHSIFNRKGLLIGVLESHSCSTETNCVRKTTSPLADCLCHCVMWCETEPVLVFPPL